MSGSAAAPVNGVTAGAEPRSQGPVTQPPLQPVPAGTLTYVSHPTSAYERAAARDPRTVLVGAEAGGGKSRLVTEFAGRALPAAGAGSR